MNNFLFYIFKVKIPHAIHSITSSDRRVMRLFTYEGILITLVNNLVSNNNNFFAARLGATDYELGLVTTLPQLVGMAVLIPGGIITDRMKNKRDMVTKALFAVACIYIITGFAPAFGSRRLKIFLFLLALSSAPMTIYNVSWQAYFSDAVYPNERNGILATRSAISFLAGVIVTLASGALLSHAGTDSGKIHFHQMFLWIAALLLFLQIAVLKKIPGKISGEMTKISVREVRNAFSVLFHNRSFLGFLSVALFFYLTWHMDWTLYFIGETRYLGMDERWLSYVNIGNAVIQFLTMGIWSRINSKHGVRFAIIFGSLGLSLCPVGMIISTSLNTGNAKLIFLILNTLFNITLATTSLNIIQCLLQVIPEYNKTLNISVYTALVTLSNGIMPMAGVTLYQKLGADLKALHTVFWIIFVLRVAATGLWALRWWILRKDPES